MDTKLVLLLLIIACALFWIYLILTLISEHDKRIQAEIDRDLWEKDAMRYKQQAAELQSQLDLLSQTIGDLK